MGIMENRMETTRLYQGHILGSSGIILQRHLLEDPRCGSRV